MTVSIKDHRAVCIAAALFLVTLLLYAPVRNHAFINYDDTLYVTANPQVQAGLTSESIAWAFGRITGDDTYWHPVTWLSHMLDCQVFGLNAGAHHMVNVVLHAVNVVLLLFLLRQMTGHLAHSAVVAALFAVHPLQVDTVAWVAERKNVLSLGFALLTLMSYARYCRRPGGLRYLLVMFLFALGLMTKPTLVVLPCVMLLLDWWPMGRVRLRGAEGVAAASTDYPAVSWSRATLEKLPLLTLSAASCAITLLAHEQLAMIQSAEQLSVPGRLANAAVSYASYLGKVVWPARLAFFYPHPGYWPGPTVLTAGAVVLGVSVLVLYCWRKRPYLTVGWLWFLGALVPAIGLIQVGDQARADRFTYLPLIGVFLALVWGMGDMLAARRCSAGLRLGLTVLAVSACAVVTRLQLRHWQDSESLFRHALAVTQGNFVAHNNLGNILDRAGRYAEARAEYEAALRSRPRSTDAHYNLANNLFREGDVAGAVMHYEAAVRAGAKRPESRHNFGIALTKVGRAEEALVQFREALRLNPRLAEAHHSLGVALFQKGEPAEAIAHLIQAVTLKPDLAQARYDFGVVLTAQRRFSEAAEQFTALVRLAPDNVAARYHLANALGEAGKLVEAEAEFTRLIQLQPQESRAYRKLAQILIAEKKPSEAVAVYRDALRAQPDASDVLAEFAWFLATTPVAEFRDAIEAVRLAERACELTRQEHPGALGALDAALAAAGRFEEAIAAARKSRAWATMAGNERLVTAASERIKLYESGQPYRQP